MKPSKFTIELQINNEKYLYNTLSNAYAKVDTNHYQTYVNVKNGNFDYDNKIAAELYNGGFIVDDNEDEIGYITYVEKLHRYGNNILGLTIAPTLQCNFRCKYCYEKHENLFMSDEIQDLLVKFVNNNITKHKDIAVSWYGGEPLLAYSIIIELSKKLIKITEKNNVTYRAGMISNGYLLTKQMAQKLKEEGRIRNVQITLDGIKEIHDLNRPLANGQGTFDAILQNIRDIIDILDISVRINVSKENFSELFKLLDLLNNEELLNKIRINIAPVSSVENTESSKIQYMCLSKSNFADIEIEFLRYLLEKNINIDYFYPFAKPVVCGAVSSNSFVIDPEGYLYKCWNMIGNKKFSIGNLKDGINLKNKEFLKWVNWEVPDKCIDCSLLPICQSGCALETFYNNECTARKYNILELLKLFKEYQESKRK